MTDDLLERIEKLESYFTPAKPLSWREELQEMAVYLVIPVICTLGVILAVLLK